MTRILASLAFAFIALAAPALAQAPKTDPENTIVMELKTGQVIIQLRPDIAPKHAARMKELTRQGFYNGVKWHRVIAGFMAQSGDPTGTGGGGSKLPNLPAEFTNTPFERGTLGAARTQDPNSANSQFFICFTQTPHLNGQYTVFGRVIEGMQHIDSLKMGAPGSGQVTDPDIIVKMQVMADVKK